MWSIKDCVIFLSCLWLFLILVKSCFASSLAFKIGTGAVAKQAQGKLIAIEYRYRVPGFLLAKNEFGVLTDRADVTSPYIFRSYGERLSLGGFYGEAFLGLGYNHIKGKRLGSHFQFTQDAAVGYKSWGVFYKHISNAGLEKPNLGQDRMGIIYTMELW